MATNSETAMKEMFLSACQRNDIILVEQLLLLGADINWRDFDGRSGLHIAASIKYGELLLDLLLAQTGVDVNIRDSYNNTPLMLACWEGHENIVSRLCQVTGVQLNTRDDGGYTALYLAVWNNRPACVSVLREVAGVDWNVRNYDGDYPITRAIQWGHADILQIILSVPEPHLDLSVTVRGKNITQIAGKKSQRCLELLSGDRRVDWNIKTKMTLLGWILTPWTETCQTLTTPKNPKSQSLKDKINGVKVKIVTAIDCFSTPCGQI